MKAYARFKSWIHNDSAASDSVVQYHATARTNWLVGKVLCLISLETVVSINKNFEAIPSLSLTKLPYMDHAVCDILSVLHHLVYMALTVSNMGHATL